MKQLRKNIIPASLLALSCAVFGSASRTLKPKLADKQEPAKHQLYYPSAPNDSPAQSNVDTRIDKSRMTVSGVSIEDVLYSCGAKVIQKQDSPKSNLYVLEIQELIKSLMPQAFPKYGLNGIAGVEFEKWVRKFQQEENKYLPKGKKLFDHGKVDRKTLVRLRERTVAPSSKLAQLREKLKKLETFNRVERDTRQSILEEFYFIPSNDREVLIDLFSSKSLRTQPANEINQLARRFRVLDRHARAVLLELANRKLPGLNTYALFDQTQITIPLDTNSSQTSKEKHSKTPRYDFRTLSLLRYFAYAGSPTFLDKALDDTARARLASTVVKQANPLKLKQSQYHGRCAAISLLSLLKHYRPAETLRIEMGLLGPIGAVRLLDGKTIIRRAGFFSWTELERDVSVLQKVVASAVMEAANGDKIYNNLTDTHYDPGAKKASRHGVPLTELQKILRASGLKANLYRVRQGLNTSAMLLRRLQQAGGEYAIMNLRWSQAASKKESSMPDHKFHAINFDKLEGNYVYYFNPHRVSHQAPGTVLSNPPRIVVDRNGREKMRKDEFLNRLFEIIVIDMSVPGGRFDPRR